MFATVASMTAANRIKRCAAERGIGAAVIQTPLALTKEGCGYSVRFDDSGRKIIAYCARELNIKVRAFFSETEEDGEKKYRMV